MKIQFGIFQEFCFIQFASGPLLHPLFSSQAWFVFAKYCILAIASPLLIEGECKACPFWRELQLARFEHGGGFWHIYRSCTTLPKFFFLNTNQCMHPGKSHLPTVRTCLTVAKSMKLLFCSIFCSVHARFPYLKNDILNFSNGFIFSCQLLLLIQFRSWVCHVIYKADSYGFFSPHL